MSIPKVEGNIKIFIIALLLFVSFNLLGCSTTTVKIYKAVGNDSICTGNNLGKVTVLPESAWRPDQKEPKKREMMALAEIKSIFQSIPCGHIPKFGGVRDFEHWSNMPESELLNKFAQEGVDTLIIIRLEELGPKLNFTFSLPFLWNGANEVDFRVKMLSTKTGTVLYDIRINRRTGGAFNIRPAEWSGVEFHSALLNIMEKK